MSKDFIDIHCHILPGIDDGSESMEESLQLITTAYVQGFRGFVATPHYYRRGNNPPLEEMCEDLQEAISKLFPDVTIWCGHETYYHEDLPSRIMEGQARCLGNSRYVLVEFSYSASFDALYRGLRSIKSHGYTPVLAHFERYYCLRKKSRNGTDRIQELHSLGVILQMNYASLKQYHESSDDMIDFLGHFGKRGLHEMNELKWCRSQLLEGGVDILGTDTHRIDYRAPETANVISWLEDTIDEDFLDILTRRNALHILNNEEIE